EEVGLEAPRDFQLAEVVGGDLIERRVSRMPDVAAVAAPLSPGGACLRRDRRERRHAEHCRRKIGARHAHTIQQGGTEETRKMGGSPGCEPVRFVTQSSPVTNATVSTSALITAMLDSGKGISDLIFSPGRPPQVERSGHLVAVPVPEISMLRPEDTAR